MMTCLLSLFAVLMLYYLQNPTALHNLLLIEDPFQLEECPDKISYHLFISIPFIRIPSILAMRLESLELFPELCVVIALVEAAQHGNALIVRMGDPEIDNVNLEKNTFLLRVG